MSYLPKELLELYRLTHKDDHRGTINNIYIDGSRAVVTDGHHLAALEHGIIGLDETLRLINTGSAPDSNEGDRTSILIPRMIAQSVLKGAKATSVFELVIFPIVKEAELRRLDTHSDERLTLRFKTEESQYPDFDQVIPKEGSYEGSESTGTCGLSFKLLSEFYAYLKAAKGPVGGLFKFKSDLDPVKMVVDAPFGQLTYVIMPFRV